MSHPLNVQADPVVTMLDQVALAHGYDYPTAIVAASATAKEVAEVADAAELVDRLLARCRVAPLVEDLMRAMRR